MPGLLSHVTLRIAAAMAVMLGHVVAPLNLGCCCVQAAIFSADCAHCDNPETTEGPRSCCQGPALQRESQCSDGLCETPTSNCCSSAAKTAAERSDEIAGEVPSAESAVQDTRLAQLGICQAGDCGCCQADALDALLASRENVEDSKELIGSSQTSYETLSVADSSNHLLESRRTPWLPNSTARSLLCSWLN